MSTTTTSTNARQHLVSLLGYAEEILRAGEPVIADLSKQAVSAFYENDLIGLEGVDVPAADDNAAWLRVVRLRETAPPEPGDAYQGWIGPPRPKESVFEPPRLVDQRVVSVSIEEASDLVEAGLALLEDILKPKGEQAANHTVVEVLLRTRNMPEFVAGFEAWVQQVWKGWELAERPRRRSMAFYHRLYEIQQRASSLGDDTPVELIFGVGQARWAHPMGRINVPLIEASVELELEAIGGAIVVRPTMQAPRMALRAFEAVEIASVGKLLRDASTELERTHLDPDVGFSPHRPEGFRPILRMCHARLASDALYEADIPGPADGQDITDGKLRITEGWVLYVRQRSTDFRCDDIRRLQAAMAIVDEDKLPGGGVAMTMKPPGERVETGQIDLRTTSFQPPDASLGSGTTGEVRQPDDADGVLFPLPYNDAQVEIIRRLERDDCHGMVVQGPPGTGKSHTIANIVSHFMASGRRVLVSAYQPEALSAIQSKLPAAIRDLTISVIHSDREGARKLEQAIEILGSQVKGIELPTYNQRRLDLEGELAMTRREITAIDLRIKQYADANLATQEWRGERLSAMDLAARVASERGGHAWFTDCLTMEREFEPRFGDNEVAEAGRLRRELGRDLAYALHELPDVAVLPDTPSLLAAHDALTQETRMEVARAAGDLPFVSFAPGTGLAEARVLRDWMERTSRWHDQATRTDPWLPDMYRLLVGLGDTHQSIRDGVRTLCTEWVTLCADGRAFVLRGITVPTTDTDAGFDAAVEKLAAGGKPFGLFSFGAGAAKLKGQLDAVQIDGAAPIGAAGWSVIRDYRAWQQRGRAFMGRWSSAAGALGFPTTSPSDERCHSELLRLGALVEPLHELHAVAHDQMRRVKALFPHGVQADRVVFHFQMAAPRAALNANLDKENHTEAHRIRRLLTEMGQAVVRPFHAAVADLAASLGKPEVQARDLAEAWQQTIEEASRLGGLRPARSRLEHVSAAIAASGALKWAKALLSEPVDGDLDMLAPVGWRRAWDWARADGHVQVLSNRSGLVALTERRAALERRQCDLLGEVVRVRTFIGLKQSITPKVASALQKYATKMRQIGAGTGKSADRHRRGLREAVLEAADAVPCWILPEWRIAEQLPAELAAFDLVIIDEASQSDITALPAVLRGKKLLIVGDDKQVSPSAVGMEERMVAQLRETYLRGMDIANFLEPTTSLYDLASMTFPGGVVLLKEHFRCVEAIIAFSSRFYPQALIPLRVPTSEERLDPPLVDIYVPDGRKLRDVNLAEVAVIVEEIEQLVAKPEFAHRSIGVISLVGDKQAKAIQDRLIGVIGTEKMTRHRIMCGNANTFQGQERDIIFLSMVACPETARSQTARMIEQRFNVALSRARDRMVLVRSVAASMLGSKDLKLAVIEHFANPFANTLAAQDKSQLEETESGFERDVANMLLDRGYRIRPQVQVGGYRIDIVVEGAGDRRVAVELDGDRYHGADRWHQDMHRQRALERLGWVFWRCWGSHWLADRNGCFSELVAALEKLGIEPLGGEVTTRIYTEHRTVTRDEKPGQAAQAASAALGTPILATDGEAPEAVKVAEPVQVPDALQVTEPMQAPDAVQLPPRTGTEVVEAGDTVLVRYADDNRVKRFRLSSGRNNPAQGEINLGQPLAEALLGNGVEEEVDLVVGGQSRRVVIEKITKAA